jgi:hypothetical protein
MRKGFVPQRRIRGYPLAGLVRQVGCRSGLVDCEELSNHGNMGSNIVIGLVDALRIGEEALKARIGFVFGDDPLSNDRELLEIAPYAYVIKNEKNRHLNFARTRKVGYLVGGSSNVYLRIGKSAY